MLSYTRLPIEGVTVSVDAFPMSAKTNRTGHFVLMGLPTPEVFVHIDGRLATNVLSFANVGKPVRSLARYISLPSFCSDLLCAALIGFFFAMYASFA